MSSLSLHVTPGAPPRAVVRVPSSTGSPRLVLGPAGGASVEVALAEAATGEWTADLSAAPFGRTALRAEAPGLAPAEAVLRVDGLLARSVGVGLEPASAAATVAWVHAVVPSTGKVRARELREGEFDLEGYCARMRAKGFDGVVSVEIRLPHPLLARGVVLGGKWWHPKA